MQKSKVQIKNQKLNDREVFVTQSNEQTITLGKEFVKKLRACNIVCLYGKLGGGKTTFAKGVALGLGIDTTVISPTFTIVREYTGKTKLYHLDFYRIEHEKEVLAIGLKDILSDKNAVVLIEWADKIPSYLPKKRWEVKFTYIDENKREILLEKLR